MSSLPSQVNGTQPRLYQWAMFALRKVSTFPAAWIVLSAATPFFALAGMGIAHKMGIQITSHGTTAAGNAVIFTSLVIIVFAIVIVSAQVALPGSARLQLPSVL